MTAVTGGTIVTAVLIALLAAIATDSDIFAAAKSDSNNVKPDTPNTSETLDKITVRIPEQIKWLDGESFTLLLPDGRRLQYKVTGLVIEKDY